MQFYVRSKKYPKEVLGLVLSSIPVIRPDTKMGDKVVTSFSDTMNTVLWFDVSGEEPVQYAKADGFPAMAYGSEMTAELDPEVDLQSFLAPEDDEEESPEFEELKQEHAEMVADVQAIAGYITRVDQSNQETLIPEIVKSFIDTANMFRIPITFKMD